MSSIPSLTGASSSPASSNNAFQEMTSAEFLEVMFAELENQDPLAPSDSKALLEQISMIRSIESDLALSDHLDAMVKQNELASASSLVGKFVIGLNSSNAEVAGFVDSVRVTNDGLRLMLSSGHNVDLDRVRDIIDPAIVGVDSGVNERPKVEDDEATVARGGEVVIDVLVNDRDDSKVMPGSVSIVSDPKHAGSITVDPETGEITYTHDGGDATSDTFQYVVKDDEGLASSPATVYISIGG